MSIPVVDEHGDQWVMNKGDLAWDAATYLKHLGFQQVRLPLRAIFMSTADHKGLLAPAPTVEVLQAINVEEQKEEYIQYASLLDQWTALVGSDVDVLD